MKPHMVRLYPASGYHIPGVAHVVQDVTPERAAELLAYRPPAFTTDPPDEPAEPEGPPDGEPPRPSEE